MRGETGVAIVEANHLQTVVDERIAKPVGPMNALGSKPHNEERDRPLRIATALVCDIYACRCNLQRLLVHRGSIEPVHQFSHGRSPGKSVLCKCCLKISGIEEKKQAVSGL